jgi:hypothetical protein
MKLGDLLCFLEDWVTGSKREKEWSRSQRAKSNGLTWPPRGSPQATSPPLKRTGRKGYSFGSLRSPGLFLQAWTKVQIFEHSGERNNQYQQCQRRYRTAHSTRSRETTVVEMARARRTKAVAVCGCFKLEHCLCVTAVAGMRDSSAFFGTHET